MKPLRLFDRPGIGSIVALGLAALPGAGAQEDTPAFTFSVSCPGEVLVAPGAAFERELEVVLDTTSNPGDQGASAWSFRVVCEGARIVGITTRGTLPAEIAGCPPASAPPGEECPGTSTLGTCGTGRTSAASVVVLSFTRPLALPPSGPVSVARIRIAGEAPASAGDTENVSLEFVDYCGEAVPFLNLVTWQGRTLAPFLEACEFEIVAGEPLFRRGDVNGDRKLDIADPISLLGCKFLGTACPGCWDGADANDDGAVDLADAVSMLAYIFLGWAPPPAPGPACGPDPTADELPACEGQSACP